MREATKTIDLKREIKEITRRLGAGKNRPIKKRIVKPKFSGVILYQGPSLLDGAPIVVILTFSTDNAKTGDMLQTWILRADMPPTVAIKSGEDSSVCGACIHRHHSGGACYVVAGHAPLSIWGCFSRGGYPVFNPEKHAHLITGRAVRLGAYGDPAAAPFETWENITALATHWTGYTHQAAHKNFDPRIASLCMVSADSPRQALKYQNAGFRTFRVAMEGDGLLDAEIECLNTTTGVECIACGLCDGARRDANSIAIEAHGTRANRFKTSRADIIPALAIA